MRLGTLGSCWVRLLHEPMGVRRGNQHEVRRKRKRHEQIKTLLMPNRPLRRKPPCFCAKLRRHEHLPAYPVVKRGTDPDFYEGLLTVLRGLGLSSLHYVEPTLTIRSEAHSTTTFTIVSSRDLRARAPRAALS